MPKLPDVFPALPSALRHSPRNDARPSPHDMHVLRSPAPPATDSFFNSPSLCTGTRHKTSALCHTLVRSYLGLLCIFNCRPASDRRQARQPGRNLAHSPPSSRQGCSSRSKFCSFHRRKHRTFLPRIQEDLQPLFLAVKMSNRSMSLICHDFFFDVG